MLEQHGDDRGDNSPNRDQPVATKNKVAVGRDLILHQTRSNKIGHVLGTASPANNLESVYVQGTVLEQEHHASTHFLCLLAAAGDDRSGRSRQGLSIPPGYVDRCRS